MPAKRKLCVVTGTRAEYGLLRPLLSEIAADRSLQLQLVVTGMHLAPEFGLTCREIEADGWAIDRKVEMLLSSDSPTGIAKSMGLAMIGFADAFAGLLPDLLVVLGDRFEIFSAVAAATVCTIPVAHLHGGETTEGVIDEAFRHSITKMAHLHFTATEEYSRRVVQLGEQPDRVFTVGAIGIDAIRGRHLLERAALEKAIGFTLGRRNLLVTFHPVTLQRHASEEHFTALLRALEELPDTHLLFTKANADTGGRIINAMIDGYVRAHPEKAAAFTSMGQLHYLSAMRLVDGVIGNSSSGLLEAPSFKIGTINIGDRQQGRVRAPSVIDCQPTEKAIAAALARLFSAEFTASLAHCVNPNGDGDTAGRILSVLRQYPLAGIVKKKFYDHSCPAPAALGR